ncbi:Gfo/Idh/MocA family oxidoreductase [Arthrobacter pigmenti]
MAQVHSRAARAAGASLLGVASSSRSSAEHARDTLGVDYAYESVEEALADNSVSVVHVCSPNVTHAPMAKAALERGKHVVCEKPLATTVQDARDLAILAIRKGRTATVPFVYRFHPMIREARARVAAGDSGQVLTVQGSYLQDWLLSVTDDDWRVDERVGGPSRAFADIGSHLGDLIEFVLNDRIVRVNARTRTAFPKRGNNRNITTEDLAAVLFESRGGVIGTLTVSQLAAGRKNRLSIEINGEHQSLYFNQEEPETLWVGERATSRLLTRSAEGLHQDAARLCHLPAGHSQGYQDAFNAFVADTYTAIAGDAPDGLPTFNDGFHAATLTSAVLDSAASGNWHDIPDTASYLGSVMV